MKQVLLDQVRDSILGFINEDKTVVPDRAVIRLLMERIAVLTDAMHASGIVEQCSICGTVYSTKPITHIRSMMGQHVCYKCAGKVAESEDWDYDEVIKACARHILMTEYAFGIGELKSPAARVEWAKQRSYWMVNNDVQNRMDEVRRKASATDTPMLRIA